MNISSPLSLCLTLYALTLTSPDCDPLSLYTPTIKPTWHCDPYYIVSSPALSLMKDTVVPGDKLRYCYLRLTNTFWLPYTTQVCVVLYAYIPFHCHSRTNHPSNQGETTFSAISTSVHWCQKRQRIFNLKIQTIIYKKKEAKNRIYYVCDNDFDSIFCEANFLAAHYMQVSMNTHFMLGLSMKLSFMPEAT